MNQQRIILRNVMAALRPRNQVYIRYITLSNKLLDDPIWKKVRSLRRAKSNDDLSRLSGIVSTMKASVKDPIKGIVQSHGNSMMFNYVTNPKFDKSKVQSKQLETWNKLARQELKNASTNLPQNGFEDLIKLTEEGKLWHFPIDNDQGLSEKEVPFEDHVFLEQLIDDRFPSNDYIRSFMELVCSGLARNHWMTVERKRDIIEFYCRYFEEKRDLYNKSGVELEYEHPTAQDVQHRKSDNKERSE